MALGFIPISELGDSPHVMVDGMARPGTVLTLSHWPRTPTPELLRADLSAEVVLNALAEPGSIPRDLDVVTIDHFDEDACVSAAMLAVEGLAETYGPTLVEVARVGDFGVVRDQNAALVAFSLASLVDPQRTPIPELARANRSSDHLTIGASAVRWALENLEKIITDVDRFEDLWGAEASAYEASTQAIGSGEVSITEHPEIDLAVVSVPDASGCEPDRLRWETSPVHLAAVCSATEMLRVAIVAGKQFQLGFRYESWVRLKSAPRLLRVDLSSVAQELSTAEGSQWVFEGASSLRGSLYRHKPTNHPVSADFFVETMISSLEKLDKGPPAWDPYTV